MPNAKDIYEETLGEINVFLTVEGFKRSGKYFRKRLPNGEVRWEIQFQQSRHNTDEEASFTFWIFAEWKRRPAYQEDWQPKMSWYGAAGGRIGEYMPGGEDIWWDIRRETSPQFLAAQIKAVLSAYALPYLRQFETEQDIIKYLREVANSSMKHNYPHALQLLNLDIFENKSALEIEESVKKARRLGRVNGVSQEVVEAAIQRVLSKTMEER